MGTLAEELARLANPAPVFHDPEEIEDFYTSAKLVNKASHDEDSGTIQPSQLRQKAALINTDNDRKYAGKKTSRQKLKDEGGDFSDELNSSVESDEGSVSDDEIQRDLSKNQETDNIIDDVSNYSESGTDEDTEEDAEIERFQSKLNLATKGDQKNFSYVDDEDYSKYSDDSDDDLSDDDDDDSDGSDVDDDDSKEMERDTEMEHTEGAEEGGVSSFSKAHADDEVQKGQAAKYQLELWDGLLEGRIKFQKIISTVNQLPQPNTWETFEDTGGDKFCKAASSAQQMLKNLLDKLVQLQTILLLQNNETKHVIIADKSETKQTAKSTDDDDDDEEITSESEVEEETNTDVNQLAIKAGVKRKLEMSDYPEFLSKRQTDFQAFRNNTIKKWNDKTKLAGGKISSKSFSAFDQSALKQIEQILSDKNRLIKRTQLKRSVYRVLGQTEEENQTDKQQTDDMDTLTADRQHSYDEEIFDDSDFYHQQLRELIERKTSDMNDPVALSRQWLEIQKKRNKVKKKVDTRASKGRKTRYNIHSKLVNFMASEDTSTWSDEARTDLFSSLFGRRFQRSTISDTSEDR